MPGAMICAPNEPVRMPMGASGLAPTRTLMAPLSPLPSAVLQPRRLLTLAYLLAFATLFGVQSVAFKAVEPILLEHRFNDSDSYTWMGRVHRLMDGAPWYDKTEPRANWPFGERVHYERSFDALLLAGAVSLTPLLGPDDGLYWSGVVISPLFYLGVALALAWGASSLLGTWRGPLAVLLLSSQIAVLSYAYPGIADHHLVIMLLFVLTWALVSRVLRDPGSRRGALVAGGVAGLGLWVGLEFMLMVAVCHAALALSWIRRGAAAGHAAVSFSLGVLAVMAIALLVERPPQEWLVPEYDQISIVHLVIMAIAVAFWLTLTRVDQLGSKPSVAADRLRESLWCGCIAFGSILFFLPNFIFGPFVQLDPKAAAVLNSVGELMPLWKAGLFEVLLTLGVGLVAVPGLIYLLVKERATPRQDEWVFLAIAIAVYLPLGLAVARFAPYAELLMVIVAAEVLVRVVEGLGQRMPGMLTSMAAGTVITIALLATYFTTLLVYNTVRARLPMSCSSQLKPLAEFLTTLGAEQGTVFTIATMADLGPELLYWTPHRVIATPHWSNEQGAIALYDLLMSEDDVVAKRIVAARDINLFLSCSAYSQQMPFFARLVEGSGPDWIEKLPLPFFLEESYDLFATRLAAPTDQ